jgi:hypothetical protein
MNKLIKVILIFVCSFVSYIVLQLIIQQNVLNVDFGRNYILSISIITSVLLVFALKEKSIDRIIQTFNKKFKNALEPHMVKSIVFGFISIATLIPSIIWANLLPWEARTSKSIEGETTYFVNYDELNGKYAKLNFEKDSNGYTLYFKDKSFYCGNSVDFEYKTNLMSEWKRTYHFNYGEPWIQICHFPTSCQREVTRANKIQIKIWDCDQEFVGSYLFNVSGLQYVHF